MILSQLPARLGLRQGQPRAPQGNVELMTEKQVLGFEPASRLEHVGDENHERMQGRNHWSE